MEIYRYLQITDDGIITSDSCLSGEINAPGTIRVDADFNVAGKKYDIKNKTWIDYTPPKPPEIEPTPTEEQTIQSETLLNTAKIAAKQQEQDLILAQILLEQHKK